MSIQGMSSPKLLAENNPKQVVMPLKSIGLQSGSIHKAR